MVRLIIMKLYNIVCNGLFLVQVFGCYCNVYVLAFSGHTRTELQLNIALHINCIK